MRNLFLCNFFAVQKLLQNCAIHNNFPGVSIKQTEPKQGKTGTQIAESIIAFYCLKIVTPEYSSLKNVPRTHFNKTFALSLLFETLHVLKHVLDTLHVLKVADLLIEQRQRPLTKGQQGGC